MNFFLWLWGEVPGRSAQVQRLAICCILPHLDSILCWSEWTETKYKNYNNDIHAVMPWKLAVIEQERFTYVQGKFKASVSPML